MGNIGRFRLFITSLSLASRFMAHQGALLSDFPPIGLYVTSPYIISEDRRGAFLDEPIDLL